MEEARRAILAVCDDVISAHRAEAISSTSLLKFALRPDVVLTFVFAIALFATYLASLAWGFGAGGRGLEFLIEGILIVASLALNAAIYVRETNLTKLEMSTRLMTVVEQLEADALWKAQENKLQIPTNINSVTIARVVRGGTVCYFPYNLLAEGDIVQLAFGDVAPGLVEYCGPSASKMTGKAMLGKGEKLKPTAFGPDLHLIMTESKSTKGLFLFRLLETPIKSMLDAALNSTRPTTIIAQQLKLIFETFIGRVLWIAVGVSLLVNLIRYGITFSSADWKQEFFFIIFNLQFYAVMPLLPMSMPLLSLIARSYGNAQIVCLFDLLQNSREEFKDEDGVDEFDAAPSPVKDVTTQWGPVWKIFIDQLVKVDVDFLARTTGLVESLASTTVICFIDREGSLSMPYPSTEYVQFFDTLGAPVTLNILDDPRSKNGVLFEDRDWQEYLHILRPLGLNMLLQTQCGHSGHRRFENHRKATSFVIDGRVKPARHTCLCRLARQIGISEISAGRFSSDVSINWYSPRQSWKIIPGDYHFEVPSAHAQIFRDPENKIKQLFCDGNVDLILEHCADYWDGESLKPLSESVERKILEFYQNAVLNDMQVVAYSYRPVPFYNVNMKVKNAYIEDHAGVETSDVIDGLRQGQFSAVDSAFDGNDELFLQEVCKGQTFLAIASFSYEPKPNVVDFIEDLGLAGIRFVYFSQAPERESKGYAEKLGLEINWNSCIILSSPNGAGNDYLDIHDLKARLPRGVENIRSHLETVDDVPLHVSLFAECSPRSITEMVKIFQENDEVVCCVGSSLNELSVDCFATADIAVAVDPFTALKPRSKMSNPLLPLNASASLTSSPCALKLHFDTSPFCLTQLIREARTLAENARQGFALHVGCQMALTVLIITSYVFTLPPILTGYQILWLMWIVLPIQCLSILFSPHDPQVMTLMPVKQNAYMKDRQRFAMYYLIRFSPTVIGCLATFIWAQCVTLNLSIGDLFAFYSRRPSRLVLEDNVWPLLFSQNMVMLMFVLSCGVSSASFVHRTLHILEAYPWRNISWVLAVTLSVLLQFVFIITSISPSPIKWDAMPPYFYVFIVVWSGLQVFVQEFVKADDRKHWTRFQKFSKLQFNTKLGMHSPL
ncbi:hypothetical protein DFJ73DRAFT_325651 [Zopfochytrium polystomum]|nr:hypothetical protein DFJ73DRAFT_325651 [Zopfochytrium polystomum]